MNKTAIKTEKRIRLHKKIRTRVEGTEARPRLAVFRSNKFMYAQLIDDTKAITLASASDISLSDKISKVERAKKVGAMLAENAKKAKITTVVFDRGGFAYAGRVQALADAAREAGLNF
jgi:large subunit ribosomal protein L18